MYYYGTINTKEKKIVIEWERYLIWQLLLCSTAAELAAEFQTWKSIAWQCWPSPVST